MKKTFLFCSILLSYFILLVSPALAEDEIRKMELDLKAKGFTQTEWQDNLQSSNIIFAPTDRFELKLTVRNLGNRNQTQIKVKQTLPSTVTTDSPTEFTIPQIAAGQDYVRTIVVTIKGKTYIDKLLTSNTVRYDAKSDVGTVIGDYASFYTANGTRGTDTTESSYNLPATGTASTLIFGSAIAAAMGFTALKLRRMARGY